jgi:hypothetical protein
MDDETKPMEESEMIGLFGDDEAKAALLNEQYDLGMLMSQAIDDQIKGMEEDEGEGVIILHPDNMQELANFIGEDEITELIPDLDDGPFINDQLAPSSANKEKYLAKFSVVKEIDTFLGPDWKLSPLATVDETPDNIKFLRSIVGDDTANTLQKVADIQGIDLEDLVRIRVLPENLNRIDILDDSIGTPHFLQLFDDQGTDISDSIGLPLDAVGQLSVDTIFPGSAMTALKNGDNKYSPPTMGKSVETSFKAFLDIMEDRERRQKRIETLQWIRSLVTRLNGVFGFDDYRQLEAFIAAWLMKNSTCRLSGIPGTGKTTVINCAATLLGNSYGYHINKTYLASDDTMDYYPLDYNKIHQYSTIEQIFAGNNNLTNAHVADIVPSGQSYNVMYNDQRNDTVYRNWNGWRFRDWTLDQPGTVSLSGSYTYGFNFLRTTEKSSTVNMGEDPIPDFRCVLPAIDGDTNSKKSIDPQKFHKLLFNCWEVEVPDDFDVDTSIRGADPVLYPHWTPDSEKFHEKKRAGKTRMVVKPIQLHDGTELTTFSSNNAPKYGSFPMTLRYPDYNSDAYKAAFDHIDVLEKGKTTHLNDFVNSIGQNGLYTDTGRNEGFWLRHLMCHWFYDTRTKDPKAGQFDISVEMLNEIGVAKIDYDKRPDEVLYGLEIRAIEAVNQNGETVNTYEFEPVPREIVTQPIKFFNEANRSQSGVEDAILGLIAEKMVEYRGKIFKSPDFVAWMDTNPHQRGNDLAFTDRIDMELLFKSVSLGGRYDQLVNKFTGKGGLEPNRILVDYMMSDSNDPNAFKPMRIGNLFDVWSMVGKQKFTSPGSSYDGFREISVISVLFSQIFASRPKGVNIGDDGIQYSFGQDSAAEANLYESPLLDYSTTTNTKTTDRGTTSTVLNDDTMIFGSADSPDAIQIPTVFTRVLGFRFTNSVVKLSQAFAFLRGKESVSRQDILDAVPYVIAHRMGRAKSGAKDMEGNNKGLDGDRIGYVNEQEFIREIVVKGYIEGDMEDASPFDIAGTNLMDNADYFYNHCRSIMDSVTYVWEYEELVLRPLHNAISGISGEPNQLTPIHWHIATMVVEEERKGRGRKVNRKYSASAAGQDTYPNISGAPTNYHKMYSNYESLILNPSPNGDPCLFDYYRLRGFIAREVNLFTNDRERLLRMLAGEVRSIAGSNGLELDLEKGKGGIRPFPQSVTQPDPSDNKKLTQTTYRLVGEGPWPRPDQIYWNIYDDAQGTYGKLIGFGDVGTYNLTNAATPLLVDKDYAMAASNQSLRVTGRYKQTQNLGQSISKYDISKTLISFSKNFRKSIGAGMKMDDEFPINTNATPITFDEWIKEAQIFLVQQISNPTVDFNDKWACFELNHAPVVTPQIGLRGMKGDDKLRIWLRLSQIGQSASASGSDLIDMLFTVGITSAPALTSSDNVGLEASGEDFEILPVTSTKQYKTKYWIEQNPKYAEDAAGKYASNVSLVDSGNMMALDRLYYNNMFAKSLE